MHNKQYVYALADNFVEILKDNIFIVNYFAISFIVKASFTFEVYKLFFFLYITVINFIIT